jgi:hypothetical protein
MICLIGLIDSVALWLFTFKSILGLDVIVGLKIIYTAVIVVFPFVGILYPIYLFVKVQMEK